jgi:hypothetical protein
MDRIRWLIFFRQKRHPDVMGVQEVDAFLTHWAVEQNVSASSQRHVLNAIVFLYRAILDREVG